MINEPVVLASSSPRRKQLLEWADLRFDVITREVDETFDPALELSEAVARVAKKKAQAVAHLVPETTTIIAADTIVVSANKPIGKPRDREEAIAILSRLQQDTHRVITGVALLRGKKEIIFSEETAVTMHALSPEQINYYVDHYKPYDKAGAYAIQEWIGVVGIKAISGDFYNVMGLPVSRVLQEMSKLQEPAM